MDGLRIRFPKSALIEKIVQTESGSAPENTTQELSSFNLSLGDLGDARLVTSVMKEDSKSAENGRIVVLLHFLEKSYQGEPLKIGVSMLLLDGEGHQIEKVKLFVHHLICLLWYLDSISTE